MSGSDELYDKILKALKQQTDELKGDIKNINLQIVKQTEVTQKKLNKIEENQKQINKNILQIERAVRKNNIIIFGLETESVNILTTVINKLNNLLLIQLSEKDINDIYKLNKKKDSPVKIEFISYLTKKVIFENIQKLKGTNIYINNDLCKADQEEQKILRHHLKQARERGYTAHIKKDKLIINSESFSADQLEKNNPPASPISPYQQSPQIQFVNSAPSTPAPITRIEKNEVEFGNVNQSPISDPNKKNTEALSKKTAEKSVEKPVQKKTRTGSTSVYTRSTTKTT